MVTINNTIKLSISNGDFSVFVEIPKETFFKLDSETVMNELKNCLKIFSNTSVDCKTEEKITPIKAIPKTNEFKIRERIPNNIIDLKDLNVKQAITERALVRCPNCGQAHCLAVYSDSKVFVLEKDFSKNDFNIIAEFDSLNNDNFINMCCKPNTDRLAYFNDLQSINIVNNNDFTANNDTEVFCPVCCISNSFLHWKDCYENPLKYFETEHLCDVCGGEKIEKIIKGKKTYLCESCGYQTECNE